MDKRVSDKLLADAVKILDGHLSGKVQHRPQSVGVAWGIIRDAIALQLADKTERAV